MAFKATTLMKTKILVVDDDTDILNILGLELNKNGFEAVLASNVQDAIKELTRHQFECAVIDIVMGPNQTSDELVKFLKNTSKNILNFDLPMIIISAHVTDDLRARMISKDPLIVDALKKPLSKNQLSSKIQEILSVQDEVDEELDVMFRPFEDAITPKADEPVKKEQVKQQEIQESNTEAMESAGINKLMHACFTGNYKELQSALIDDPDSSLVTRSLDGKTCLHYAARGESLDIVDFLLVSGLKVNERDKKGHEPLYEAVIKQDIEMCKHLIFKGARVNSKFDEKTYLMIASAINNLEIFELFLKEGVNSNLVDGDGKTVKVYLKMNMQHDFIELIERYAV